MTVDLRTPSHRRGAPLIRTLPVELAELRRHRGQWAVIARYSSNLAASSFAKRAGTIAAEDVNNDFLFTVRSQPSGGAEVFGICLRKADDDASSPPA
jgi:hypothetical protein